MSSATKHEMPTPPSMHDVTHDPTHMPPMPSDTGTEYPEPSELQHDELRDDDRAWVAALLES